MPISTPAGPARPVRAGLALFALGLGFIAADVTPFFLGAHDRPLWLNLGCLLAPLGFGLAVWSGLRAGRAEQRAVLEQVTRQSAGQAAELVAERVADH